MEVPLEDTAVVVAPDLAFSGVAAAFVALPGGATAVAAELNFPALSGRVVDQAGILSAATETKLTGWLAGLEQEKRTQVVVVTLPNLQGVQIETLASFPAQIRRAYAKWEVATVRIEDKPYQVAQGSNPGQAPVNFYFDQSSGLLTRIVRWNRTKVGAVPSQMDFSDYRDVGGVKMPFETLLTWTDGQNTIKLSDVKTNVAIDARRFAKPAPFRAR